MWTMVNEEFGAEREFKSWEEFAGYCRHRRWPVPIRCQRINGNIETLDADNGWQQTLVRADDHLVQRVVEVRGQLLELAGQLSDLSRRAQSLGERQVARALGRASNALGTVLQSLRKL